MNSLRSVVGGAVALMLSCALVGVVAAQDESAGSMYTPVSGQRLTADFDDRLVESWAEGGVTYMDGFVTRETWEWSDSRLPASSISTIALADYRPSDGWPGEVIYGSVLMDGPDGYWTGTTQLFADEANTGHGMMVLTGHGAYEGLFGLLMGHTDDPDCIECETYVGAIYGGAPPPMPQPPER